MSEPFLAELKLISWNFPPKGWTFCNGQLLPINQNQPLFALLGTTYGGNGQTNFALPNLQGKAPNHFGGSYTLGETGGEMAHTLNMSELPQHLHGLNTNLAVGGGATNATQGVPTGNFWSNSGKSTWATSQPNAAMNPAAVTNVGGSQPHNNMQPYLVLNFCIALQGIFPSQN